MVSSKRILMAGDVSSSYWPFETLQIKAIRNPEAMRRLAMMRMRMTLNDRFWPKVSGAISLPDDVVQSKT
jgi:hypothetical protein